MSGTAGTTEQSWLNLLLFSVGKACFGVDLEQIDGMAEHSGELAADLHWLHEALGFGDEPTPYRLPRVLSIKTDSGQPYRVIIDNMEEIAEFRWTDITPFPALLEPQILKRGMWGVVQRDGQIILLVDFQRIARNILNP